MEEECTNCGGTGLQDCPNPKCRSGKVEVIPLIDMGAPHEWQDCDVCRGEAVIKCRNRHCIRGQIKVS